MELIKLAFILLLVVQLCTCFPNSQNVRNPGYYGIPSAGGTEPLSSKGGTNPSVGGTNPFSTGGTSGTVSGIVGVCGICKGG